MSTFVNFRNTKHRPDGKYGKVISHIRKAGVCPFCPAHLSRYHRNPILANGKYWLLTDNMYPYRGAKHHVLIVHKRHIESFARVSPGAWAELRKLIAALLKKRKIRGGTFLMRFGDTARTGASVSHLHANLIASGAAGKRRKPILARVG